MCRRLALALALLLALGLLAANAFADTPADEDSTLYQEADTTDTGPPPGAVTPPPPPPAPAVTAPVPAAVVAPAKPLPPPPVSPASILGPNSPSPTPPHLVAPRPDSLLRAERDHAMVSADAGLLEARKKLVEAQSLVEKKKQEIDQFTERIKTAKDGKDEATRVALENERKRQASMLDYFTRAQEVAQAVVDEAQARNEFAIATVRVLDVELQLAALEARGTFGGDPAVFRLEQQYLDAQRLCAASEEKVATRAQATVDRKLRLYRAWAEYLGAK